MHYRHATYAAVTALIFSGSTHLEHGYSLREIATHLGCSVTTVHRRVHACGDGGRGLSALAAGGTKKT